MQALVLGSAQWGNAYGVTNTHGRLADSAVAEIAEMALASGIEQVDTAGDYGDAEVRLAPWASRFAVTTKVKGTVAASIAEQLRLSLARLQVDSVRCALVHDWPMLTNERAAAVAAELRDAQGQGLTRLVGISAYDEADLLRSRLLFADLDVVQVPVSILDRRLHGSGAVAELLQDQVQIQARSVFLQGLLAGPSSATLGSHPDVRRFQDNCVVMGLEPRRVALAFIKSLGWVDQVVLGVTSGEELSQILDAWKNPSEIDLDGFVGSSDDSLIDPRQWV